MSESSSPTCARCGAPMPADAPNQACPACLMSDALAAPGAETVPGTRGRSPEASEPSEFPRAFGGYQLLGLLGSGGMGTVYEAHHLATGRRVALKMLDRRLDSTEIRQRFLREGRLAARVNHPNSLYIFGSDEIEGAPVITMEIAGSGTLEDKLKKRGPFAVTEAVDAILDVISGLEAAFAGGVLHRDIKPSNCFVSPDGSVKVGDYGLSVSTFAKEDSFATAAGAIMGTPAYAPPEQLRGDDLDVRGDIYSVGATLFTLITGRPPFEGRNVVQVVANAVNQSPKPLSELREGVPPGLERIVACCLAKEPQGRYEDYVALRSALLPFSSEEPEPASMLARVSAGWIDYLIAFLPPYVALMFLVGAGELIVRPLVDRTVYSARYYLLLLGLGCLYFVVLEGIWGCGLGKWLKGLRVMRANGRPPGIFRALIRTLVPILCMEGVRLPVTMVFISTAEWTGAQTALFVLVAVACGWIPAVLAWTARRDTGYATLWDRASQTRVVVKLKGTVRPAMQPGAQPEGAHEGTDSLGPYQVIREVVPGRWIVATDPVLRRPIWLLRRDGVELPLARRRVARPGRLRWLQEVETAEAVWDAYEAPLGVPFPHLVDAGQRVPWGTLRHWLHDLASELWEATGDKTLPAELSLDHLWIAPDGHAILLDESWPNGQVPADRIPVSDVTGQQRFLSAFAACVDSTGLPLHARPVLRNLEDGRFEKLSFFTGTLRGLLDRPAVVSRGIRGCSIFLLPLYVWIALFVGYYHDKPWRDALDGIVIVSVLGTALLQFLELPFRSTAGQFAFRLAVVDEKGERATRSRLLVRWAIVWLPLLLPMSFAAWLFPRAEGSALILASVVLLPWVGAAVYSVIHPHRGLQDRWAHTWVVRR